METVPPYTLSSPAPSYSRDPSADEERLAFTHSSRRSQTGKLTKKSGNITLVLYQQDDRAQVPSYGRNSIVSGTICLDNCSEVSKVNLKVEGWLRLAESKDFWESTRILSDKYTLWKGSFGEPCQSAVHPFDCIFPSVYEAKGRTQPLPPSYQIALPGGFSAECVYSLTIIVTKTRRRLALWRKSEILKIILDYHPRTRSPRPISAAALLSTIKPTPEEWYQIIATTQTRPGSDIKPITCNLFIPSTQIYAHSDIIPFHIQLSAPLSSMKALFKPVSPCPSSSTRPSDLAPSHIANSAPEASGLRVFLAREIITEVHGHTTKRMQDIGEGTIRALPPTASHVNYVLSDEREVVLDWEGEVQCLAGVSGGFYTNLLFVKDYLVFALSPPNPATSPLLVFQHAHPIRLVTDPYLADW